MSIIKQLFLSILVLAVLSGGWFAYERWRGDQNAVGTAADAATGPAAKPGSGGGSGGSGAAAKYGRGPLTIPVVAGPVEIDATGDEMSAIGTLTAAQEVELIAQDTGVVKEIDFTPGGQVTAGQVLIRLDDEDQKVALDKAKIALDDAKATFDRSQKLASSNNITAVALSDAKIAAQKAEIDVRTAQIDLDKRTMTAPFAGTIGLTDISIGDLVTSSKAIASLDDVTSLTVDFQTPERFVGKVTTGYAVNASAESLPGKEFPGKIVALDSRIDETSRTLKMKASLPNDTGILKPGMGVTVTLSLPGEPHPSVPSLAIQWDRQGSFVWKVSGDTVTRASVTILDRHGRSVTVLADLTPSDRVAVEGVQSLREGAKVQLVDDQASGSTAPPGKVDNAAPATADQTTAASPVKAGSKDPRS